MTRPSTSARPLFRCQQCRFSSSAANSKPARIVASLLLARSPLIQPPLSSFEKSHYAYNKSLKAALSDDFDSTAYFAKGSQAERTFEEQQKQKMVASLGSDEPLQEPEGSTLQSVDRKQDRTLYLLLRKQRAAGQKGAWQFPQGGVEDSDATIVDAAVRELREEVGPNLDIFLPSRVPASVYNYNLPSSSSHAKQYGSTKAFFIPARALRGQAKLSEAASQEGIKEFAWCTREEVQERVDPEYWEQGLQQGHLLAS